MSDSAVYRSALVVIPTRNRARLAANAIRSVLDQPARDIRVFVSDNSTSAEERDALARFCRELADPRLRYATPPAPLSMSKHWEWALAEALRQDDATHFIYLTDRMMFRRGALGIVTDLARLYPDKIISYNHDKIADYPPPIRVEQYPHTGKLLEVKCERLSYLYSQATLHPCLPRMLNCIAPRASLEAVRKRFGTVFDSIAPDFNFGFRCLELFDSIYFYDASPIFHYGLERSNGASVTRGELTRDHEDFIANLPVDNSIRNYATPIPQIITAGNAVLNEYCIMLGASGSKRFFELDKEKYLALLSIELNEVENPQTQAQMRALLVEHGARRDNGNHAPPSPQRSAAARVWKVISTGNISNKSLWRERVANLPRSGWSSLRARLTGAKAKPVWLFVSRYLPLRPPDENRFEFKTTEEAVEYLNSFPRRPRREPEAALEGVELHAPQSR